MSFDKDLGKFIAKFGKNSKQVVKKIGLDLQGSVMLKTPVDEGTLRANWQLSLNQPIKDEKDDTNATITLSEGVRNMGAYQGGEDVWIVNNLPYAVVVEYGLFNEPKKPSTKRRAKANVDDNKKKKRKVDDGQPKTVNGFSKQAPQGMRDITVEEFQQFVRKQVRP